MKELQEELRLLDLKRRGFLVGGVDKRAEARKEQGLYCSFAIVNSHKKRGKRKLKIEKSLNPKIKKHLLLPLNQQNKKKYYLPFFLNKMKGREEIYIRHVQLLI